MRIPFLNRKSEDRSAPSGIDYTEALANALVERAIGTEGARTDADLTTAVEASSGLVARALSMASINPRQRTDTCAQRAYDGAHWARACPARERIPVPAERCPRWRSGTSGVLLGRSGSIP